MTLYRVLRYVPKEQIHQINTNSLVRSLVFDNRFMTFLIDYSMIVPKYSKTNSECLEMTNE